MHKRRILLIAGIAVAIIGGLVPVITNQSTIVQPIINGLLGGSIIALAALGLSMIFSVMGVLNLAHGDFMMLGGFLGFLLAGIITVSAFGGAAVIIIFLAAFLLIALLGAAYEFASIRYILKRSSADILVSSILLTVGTALIVETVGSVKIPDYLPFNSQIFQIPVPVQLFTISFGSITIEGVKLIALTAVVAATIFLYFFSKYTYLGKSMRAISQNKESAMLMGVNPQRISVLTFSLGSGFGAVAGVSIAMVFNMSAGFGLPYTITLLAVLVLGGTRSYLGPLFGGLIIGLLQSFVQSGIVNSYFPGLYYWTPVVSIIVLIVVLMVRPTGLTGGRGGFGRA